MKTTFTTLLLIALISFFTGCGGGGGGGGSNPPPKKSVTGIKVTTPPAKTIYFINDPLDLTGIAVTAYYNDSTNGVIGITAANTNWNSIKTSAGNKTVTITINSKTATFEVTLSDAVFTASELATALPDHLNSLDPAPTVDSPAPIKIAGLDTSNTAYLYDIYNSVDKPVWLDLSDSNGGSTNTFARHDASSEAPENARTNIVHITLPDSVTAIAECAFSDDAYPYASWMALKSVSGAGVTTIGERAFQRAYALKTIDLPEATTIGELAFWRASALKTIYLPEATTIGVMAFSETALASVNLPKATTIGGSAFYRATALESVNLPKATTIGNSAFQNASALKTIYLPEATTIGELAFIGAYALTSINLPKATTIGSNAFSGAIALTTVNLPKATTIGDYAFSGAIALRDITLGNTPPQLVATYAIFDGITGTITIHVPSGKKAVYATWVQEAYINKDHRSYSRFGNTHESGDLMIVIKDDVL